jgi:hypothetical protein
MSPVAGVGFRQAARFGGAAVDVLGGALDVRELDDVRGARGGALDVRGALDVDGGALDVRALDVLRGGALDGGALDDVRELTERL